MTRPDFAIFAPCAETTPPTMQASAMTASPGRSRLKSAKKTAGQLGKMIKYAVIAGIIFLIISILKSEF